MAAAARAGVVILFLGLCASDSAAQDGPAEPKWQVEVHSAGLFPGNPTRGTPITQFPPGAPIPTGQATMTSRAVSTWYFGDGTSLLNQVNTTLGVPARLTALDPILREPLAHRRTARALGARAGRLLTPRLVAEINVDYAVGALGLTEETRRGLDAASSTFISAWNGLLLTGATSNRKITSVTDSDDGDDPMLSLTGALKTRLLPGRRVVPYATVGAGTIFHLGTTPSATLTGDYGFQFSNDPRFNRPSSLSGPAITDLRTFTGSGMRTDTHFALGYFVRF
jgi:hypothetical protein